MKLNKKHIGWIIGLVCVVILVVLGLRMCGSAPDDVTEPTDQTEESTLQTETTEATEDTEETEPTEESTEPTEESTEETTEPTEATTFPTAPPTSSAIGSPGSLGRPDDPTEESTEPTEPTEPVIIPAGQDTNPYSEVIREYPAGFESVNVPGKSMVTYAVFVNSGAELTIEDPDAYVIHGGKTYEPVEGVVKLLLTAEKKAPVMFQLGNKAQGEKLFQLSFIDALGEPTNPQILEKIEEVKVKLEEDDKTGYTFCWTAPEEGNVTFQVAQITEKVNCDVILTVGEMSVHLVQPETKEQEPSEQAEEKIDSVSIGLSKDDVLTIQVITLAPEKEVDAPVADGSTEPTEPAEPEAELLPAAEITLKGAFEPGQNQDKEEQEQTKPTEPSEPEETKPTEPEGSEPTEPDDSQPTEPTEPAGPAYSVTVTDYNGNPKTGVVVQILKDGAVASMIPVDTNGVAAADLEAGNYTVKLLFSGENLYYEEKNAVLTETASHITLKVAPAVSGAPESINDANAYVVEVGGTYVQTQADVVNYFIFTPTVAGNYQVTTSDPEAVVSYWGGNIFFLPAAPYEMEMTGNAYHLNVKDSNIGEEQGVTHIIGITGAEDCILEIIRVGDPVLDEEDMPYTEYGEGKEIPAYTYSGSGKKKFVDITAATDSVKLVLNAQDGYYHMNTEDGPLAYLYLGENTNYIPLYSVVGVNPNADGGENVYRNVYENDVLIRRELFNPLLIKYANSADKTQAIYPLTEDLVYMIRHGGDRKGWWDPESMNYMFTEYPGTNNEIAWMFAICTME